MRAVQGSYVLVKSQRGQEDGNGRYWVIFGGGRDEGHENGGYEVAARLRTCGQLKGRMIDNVNTARGYF